MTYISWSCDFALYLKDRWCRNILLQNYESVWPDVQPKNKCRSLWPIFHGPVILPYIWKTIWCMNIIVWDYESVWHNIWPQNKCKSLWPVFHGPVILPYILKIIWYMNTIWDYESVWPDVWPQNIYSTCDLYFMYIPNICRSLWSIFHGALNLPFILKTVWCMNIILSDYVSVWHKLWPRNKCRSLWPTFHGPVILPFILNSIWWMNVILLENELV